MTLDPIQVVSYAMGVVVVVMHGADLFAKLSIENSRLLTITKVATRDLTSAKQFSKSCSIYIMGLLAAFFALSYCGKKVLQPLFPAIDQISDQALPLFAALCVVGLLTKIPGLSNLELLWRTFMQRRAAITRSTDELMISLGSADVDYGKASSSDATLSMLWQDMLTPGRVDLLNQSAKDWARLNAILNINSRANLNKVNYPFMAANESFYQSLVLRLDKLQGLFGDGGTALDRDVVGQIASRKRTDISALMDDTLLYIACIVISSQSYGREKAAEICGFTQIGGTKSDENYLEIEFDVVVNAIGTSIIGVVAIVAVLPLFSSYIPGALPSWPRWESYGANLFSYIIAEYLPICLVVSYAWASRRKGIINGSWYSSDIPGYRVHSHKYLVLGIKALSVSVVAIAALRLFDVYAINQYSFNCDVGSKCKTIAEFSATFVTQHWVRAVVPVLVALALVKGLDRIRRKGVERTVRYWVGAFALAILLGLMGRIVMSSGSNEAQLTGEMIVYAIGWVAFLLLLVTAIVRQYKEYSESGKPAPSSVGQNVFPYHRRRGDAGNVVNG